MEYATTSAALVPRPETELLVELALELIPTDTPLRICDLGTGTGIIAITLKKQRPLAKVCATDVDSGCLALARENARRHSVEINFIESNWYQNLEPGRRFDMIVSNPPYVAANHPFLAQGDLPAEPQIALTPGSSGLEAFEVIISGALDHLEPGGSLILEHGYDQEAAVAALLQSHGFTEIRCESDHNNLPRTTIAHLHRP
jgi:release factor glutamine methyltransferase